ncbi:DUF6634 family protein [Sinorhizobium sp. BG8]|uniref:DUF6634 family protein n=1 Tax=Sinorhizobium sp. BG8 TaxID=2613773 RepID=UPI00193D7AEA|nr:DUF6634 family protein [Sinorhizobium sp. BG8]QRM56407.1 hypothetical protein F3Y30_19090 [Sinorhizobium sp. BG8]
MAFNLIDPHVARRLLDDLRRFSNKELDEEDFAMAPVLRSYRLTLGPAYALSGTVSGHPYIPDGREIVSSQLFFLDSERAVARTLNRWYRLGMPHGSERN